LVHNRRTQPRILSFGPQIKEDGALEERNEFDKDIKSEELEECKEKQKDFQKVTKNLQGQNKIGISAN
jgi:hypothetical protein